VEPRRLLDALFEAAKKLGVEVRVERFSAPLTKSHAGGVCRLKGRDVILIDAAAAVVDQAAAMAESLSHFELGGLFLAPEVRELVESARVRIRWRTRTSLSRSKPRNPPAQPGVRTLSRPKPGLRRTRPRSS
jgi:hypothetical protein